MTKPLYGSYAWAQRDEGRMTAGEKLVETLRGLLAVTRARLQPIAAASGLSTRSVTLALADVPQPETPLTAAARVALDGAPPWVLAHSMRTYLWGWLLGRREVLAAWPRGDFLQAVSAALRSESSAHPDTRIAFLCRQLGFLRLAEQGERRFRKENG